MIGEGLGGFETFTWACEYPDEMEFIFVVNSSYKLSGYRYIIAKGQDSILDISDDYYDEIYSTSLSKMLISANTFVFAHTASKRIFDKISNDEIDALMEDFIDECLFSDIYDFKFRNDCILKFDIEDKLSNIKAKTLILATNNNYFDIELDALPLKDMIDDCVVLTHEPLQENYYFAEDDYSHLGPEVISFIEQFKK